MSALIEIKNCSLMRGDRLALDNICLNIEVGESLAIIGPNGSGKSSLLKLLARELYPIDQEDSYIRILGEEHFDKRDYRAHLGWVSPDLQQTYHPETPGLEVVISGFFDSNSLWQHFEFNSEQISQAEATLERHRISELAKLPFGKLSTGQQRRLLLARALVHQPKTLILDEPTTGLDIGSSFQYLETIQTLIQDGTSILLVTHHIHEIPPEIKRIILLQNGRIIDDGPRSQILTEQRLSKLFNSPICLSDVNGYIQAHPK